MELLQSRCELTCPGCEAVHPLEARWFGCDLCRDAAGLPHWLEVRYHRAPPADFARRPGRLWDYADLLPVEEAYRTTLGEGATPLVRLPALNREIGLDNLYLKLEMVNPTGSFKDRYHAVSISMARQLGYSRACISTTGNSGVACAAYAAAAGVALIVVTDPLASPEQLRLMRLFGARVTAPSRPGPVITQARALMESLVRDHGFCPCTVHGTHAGTANPYAVEGYKTIAFEIFGQLGRVPDRVCVPTAGGDALYGPYKGFRELREWEVTASVPRMTACQAEGANFAVRAIREQSPALPTVDPHTFALSIADPTGSQTILEAIRSSDGDAWEADDPELLDTMALLGRHGVCVEGASAAPVAALRRQVRLGEIDPGETVVAVLTGTGMKWTAQIDAAVPPKPLLPDSLEVLLEGLA